MRVRRLCALLCVLAFLFALAPARAGAASDAVMQDEASRLLSSQSRNEYALLIGVDSFVSRADTYPSSTNNVNAMQEVFQGALNPFRAIIVPPNPVTTVEQLTALVQKTFGAAGKTMFATFIFPRTEYTTPPAGWSRCFCSATARPKTA